MAIEKMRDRAIFETRQIVTDAIGNQSSQWTREFTRWCEVKPVLVTESDSSATTDVREKLRLTFRDERLVRELDSRQVRLILRDKVYQVTANIRDYPLKGVVTIDVERCDTHDQD